MVGCGRGGRRLATLRSRSAADWRAGRSSPSIRRPPAVSIDGPTRKGVRRNAAVPHAILVHRQARGGVHGPRRRPARRRRGQGRHRARDRRQPVRVAGGRCRRRRRGDPGRPHHLRPVGRAARASRRRRRLRQRGARAVGDRRPRHRGTRRQDVRAAVLRCVRRARRRRARVQPVLSDLRRQHRPARGAHGAVEPAGVAGVPAQPRRRAPLPRGRPAAQGRLPQQPPQPHRRRRDRGRPPRARRPHPGPQRGGVRRRALRLHGVGGPAPVAARPARHARADRRRLHVQQVVQHERLAPRLRGVEPRDDQGLRPPHERGALVRAPVHAARRGGRPSRAAGSTATSGCATSTARSSCWWPA